MKRQQLVGIFICFLMNMLDGMDVMVISYASPNISNDWAISSQSLGIVFSAGLIGMTIGAMFLAPKADNIGRKMMIIICNIIMGLSIFLTSLAENIEWLIFFRIISGVGIGGMLASTATMTAEYAPTKTKDFWVSFVMAGYPIGAVISGIVAASVIPQYGWESIFKIAGIMSLLTLPIIYFFLRESNEYLNEKNNKTQKTIAILLDDSYRISTLKLWIGIFFAFGTLYFLTTWIPKLASATGLSEKLAIYAGTVFNLGAFIGIVSQGYLSSRFGLQKTISTFFVFTAVLMLFFGNINDSILILIMFGFIGFGIQGGFVGLYSLAARLYPTNIRATGVGGAVGIGRIGAIVGPLLGGILIGHSISMAHNFIIFAIPTIVGGLVILTTNLKSD